MSEEDKLTEEEVKSRNRKKALTAFILLAFAAFVFFTVLFKPF